MSRKQSRFPVLSRFVLTFTLPVLAASVAGAEPVDAQTPEPINIAVAQMEINEALYFSMDSFAEEIQDVVGFSVTEDADLVVFPEYINVFLPAVRFGKDVARSDTVAGALWRMRDLVGSNEGIRNLLIETSPWIRSVMDDLYGGLARRHELYILAGTYFAVQSDRITNRSVVYGPDGSAVWEQDKVFLTEVERRLLGLDEGRLEAVESFTVEGFDVGVTICRDLFFSEWEEVHRDKDIWIDLRAEGTRWEQGREDFVETLPHRIVRTGSDYGVTAALTGTFLDLYWEGKSVVFEHTEDGDVRTVAAARSPRRQEVIVVTLEHRN